MLRHLPHRQPPYPLIRALSTFDELKNHDATLGYRDLNSDLGIFPIRSEVERTGKTGQMKTIWQN